MSTVASRVRLTHLCSIERDGATTDDWGLPGEPDWATNAANVPCYAWVEAGREAIGSDRAVVVRDMRIVVPLDTDVTEGDRVGDVTERGEVIFPGPLQIEAVLRYPTHLELMMEAQG